MHEEAEHGAPHLSRERLVRRLAGVATRWLDSMEDVDRVRGERERDAGDEGRQPGHGGSSRGEVDAHVPDVAGRSAAARSNGLHGVVCRGGGEAPPNSGPTARARPRRPSGGSPTGPGIRN